MFFLGLTVMTKGKNILLSLLSRLFTATNTKATEQYFPVVPFAKLYKMVLNLELMDEILMCDHYNEAVRSSSSVQVLSCGTGYHAVQGGTNFCVRV